MSADTVEEIVDMLKNVKNPSDMEKIKSIIRITTTESPVHHHTHKELTPLEVSVEVVRV